MSQKLSKELIELEKKYWRAMQEQDLETALSLTDFPCLVAGPQGAQLVERQQFIEMFKGHGNHSMDVSIQGEPDFRLIDDRTAVLAYEMSGEMTVDGKKQTMSAVNVSTWIQRDGGWVCALHTETPLKQQEQKAA